MCNINERKYIFFIKVFYTLDNLGNLSRIMLIFSRTENNYRKKKRRDLNFSDIYNSPNLYSKIIDDLYSVFDHIRFKYKEQI